MRWIGCSSLQRGPLTGTWYRVVQYKYALTSLSTAHTRLINSRFSPGAAAVTPFEMLYLSQSVLAAQFESRMWFGDPADPLSYVPRPRLVPVTVAVRVSLRSVVNLTEPASLKALQTDAQELTGDWKGYQTRSAMTALTFPTGKAPTQKLGERLFREPDIEGFVFFSSKVPYEANLAVFPSKLKRGSQIVVSDPGSGLSAMLIGES